MEEGETLTLGARPEHLGVGEREGERPSVTASVNLTEQLGGESFIYGTLASGEALTIKQPGQIFIKPGATIPVRIDPDTCHLFDREGRALARTSRHRRPALMVGGGA